MTDIYDSGKLIVPQLLSFFGTSPTLDEMELDTEDTVTLTEPHLKYLFGLLGGLYWTVDDKGHIQQMVGTTKVRYVPM